jgi:hypothetical protein
MLMKQAASPAASIERSYATGSDLSCRRLGVEAGLPYHPAVPSEKRKA